MNAPASSAGQGRAGSGLSVPGACHRYPSALGRSRLVLPRFATSVQPETEVHSHACDAKLRASTDHGLGPETCLPAFLTYDSLHRLAFFCGG